MAGKVITAAVVLFGAFLMVEAALHNTVGVTWKAITGGSTPPKPATTPSGGQNTGGTTNPPGIAPSGGVYA